MPTVTAVALETFLEPGSSSSPTSHQHHPRHHSTGDPASASPAPRDHLNSRRHSTNGATTSPQEHHRHVHLHHHHGGRREQQPVFLSRRPREDSNVAGASADAGGRTAQPAGSRARTSANGYYISPKLYATPEPTQIVPTGGVSCSSPNSVSSPSPYVVNHKRRDVPRPRPPPPSPPTTTVAAASNGNGASSSPVAPRNHRDGFDSMTKPPDLERGNTDGGLSNGKPEGSLDGAGEEVVGRGGGMEGIRKVGEQDESFLHSKSNSGLAENECPDAVVDDDEDDDFFDPRELMSAVSSSDTEDTNSFRCGGSGRFHTPLASQSEFYDATEDFLSDGSISRSSPSSRANIEADLRSIRLNLFEEIDRRKKAEEALDHMQNMFQRIARQASQVSFPGVPEVHMQYDVDSIAQFCQEAVVMRFVSEALESCLAHVETETAAEAIIEAKNHEIARLRDRLQYYEAMNQEMSQRNQEAIELARRRRQKRKMMRRWIWSGIGLSVTVGASLMAYFYLSHGGENPTVPSSEQHDTPSGTMVSEGSLT